MIALKETLSNTYLFIIFHCDSTFVVETR